MGKAEIIRVTAELVKDASDCVVVKSEDGRIRRLYKHNVVAHIEGTQVTFEIDKNNWMRRLQVSKTNPEVAPAVDTWTRNCLCCGTRKTMERKMFVCDACKETELWKAG